MVEDIVYCLLRPLNAVLLVSKKVVMGKINLAYSATVKKTQPFLIGLNCFRYCFLPYKDNNGSRTTEIDVTVNNNGCLSKQRFPKRVIHLSVEKTSPSTLECGFNNY